MSLEKSVFRRHFLKWATFAIGGAASVLVAIPFVGYLFGALRKREVQWVPLGAASRFPVNETRLETFDNPLGAPWDGMAARMGVYVRNLGDEKFLVFAMNLRHLGCPVTWFPQSGLFMCPCHGGVYYEDGRRRSGPPTARIVRVRLANQERRTGDPIATPSHVATHPGRARESLRIGHEAFAGHGSKPA